MKASATFTILFWINTTRIKNNKAEIYVRITVNGKRTNISLKRKINVSSWDKKKGRARGNGTEARIVNLYLDQVQAKLFKSYQDLMLSDELINCQTIKSRFLGEDKKHQTIQSLIQYHNDKMFQKLHKDTMRHYNTTQKYIMIFIKKEFRTDDMYLKELNYNFVLAFEDFLRSYQPTDHQRRIGNNTVMKHIQRLRKMVTLAYHMEWIVRDPFIKFKATHEKKERGFLIKEELQRLEKLSPFFERLEIVQDLFIFSCYTGIAYGDIMLLNRDNLMQGIDGNRWIITRRKKTGTPIKIPLLPKAKAIINKYRYHPKTSTKTIPTTVSNFRAVL